MNLLFFGVYPYIALSIFLIGSWARFDLSQYTWRAGSSQILHRKGMRVYSNLFHVGILIILFGHLFGLLTPDYIYHYLVTTGEKQILAMTVGGIAGIMCLIGLVGLIIRRLKDDRVRANSNPSDIMILFVLLIQLCFGLASIVFSTQHLDGSEMVRLADWAQYIVTFRPMMAAVAVEPVGIIFKIHICLGLFLFILFPFTRLVHILSAPVWYLGRRYQVVRQKQDARVR